ncbi:MAG: pyridine nucleotide-disulfide oxidoreductase [Proteobacteria bacterium]|nr:pyridine nucleotide-disulfide oxidoreductase [Pseudomonadota bacterium]NDC23365.1 pyridine nucleotide-disulfide oxidoreductase [Pseudomonadota bacterium]NDD03611.1 pyridine nucleotide-disulfide oxidoreductase [Pseudomonadota bacterium]NDG26491.1 pyridine nucleotide-disulfide oxidoreductase [Pseudomonadota bacterium]
MNRDGKDFPLGIPSFNFSDLYQPLRLRDLHTEFWKYCQTHYPEAAANFQRLDKETLPSGQEGDILIAVGRVVGEFVAKLFNVSGQTSKIKTDTSLLQIIFKFKKDFLNTRVFKRFEEAAFTDAAFKELNDSLQQLLSHAPPTQQSDEEGKLAELVAFLLDCEQKLKKSNLELVENQKLMSICSHLHGQNPLEKTSAALKIIEDWCVQVYVSPKQKKRIENWLSYRRAGKLDFDHLVECQPADPQLPEKLMGPSQHLRYRDGFKLTDSRMSTRGVLREVDYCILCHPRQKDSCSKGFPEKTGGFKKNPLGIPLAGCPLEERISEMHTLRKEGRAVGSLAMIMLDNPMCPGTGHRICNDCMKGCIYQKQDPVNIPQIETGVLSEVLNLPYGFEIYSLFTRWNPLNRKRPYALPYNGKNVLVVGLGPAGYTVCHYLANEGFGVVGIDALKLEPVDPYLSGKGKPQPKAIQQFSELKKELDERVLMGFGGVSEYGITVRWDKNFLSVIYLSLLRRNNVHFFGGVRFGGTLTLEDAWELGFDHVALATGAGKPTLINIKNNLSRGIRKASDFLMGLQLNGGFKKNTLFNLEVRLPALVIGGGLTGIDTATELLAYYPIQVENVLNRFESLCHEFGENSVWAMCSEEEKLTLTTFLEHGRAIREERAVAKKEKRQPNFISLCRKWGGVSLAYRKRMQDSPAYRLNHEEIIKALEEGIYFIENVSPVEALKDRFGAVEGMVFKKANGETVTLAARTVCVAAGTSPNTIYEREFPGTFKLDKDGYFFQSHRLENTDEKWKLKETVEGEAGGFFLSHENSQRFVSYFGDNHPDFNGNVVKAMASAKKGVPFIAQLFKTDIQAASQKPVPSSKFESLIKYLDSALVPRIHNVVRLTDTIVEVIVKARYAARKFEPGQFYRLQNYETLSHSMEGTRLLTESLALTGAWVDKENDLLSMVVLEMGGSSRLCASLRPGDPVVVMGPTGAPSEIPENKTVLLAGGGLGNAVLLSISRALRAKGSKVLYFAGYKKSTDIFKQKEIEDGTDQVIWAVDKGSEPIRTNRKQDRSFVGNIVEAMLAYGKGELDGAPLYPLDSVDHMIVIGSDRMMAAVTASRHGVLKPFLKPEHVCIASINSPMQCMMKEVCAQCLQRHVDPVTKKESFVFSCFNQDQISDCVDYTNLNDRLKQNSLTEKLTNKYIDVLFKKGTIERI